MAENEIPKWRLSATEDDWALMNPDDHLREAQALVAGTGSAIYTLTPFTFVVASLHMQAAQVQASREIARMLRDRPGGTL